jgi:hypothetical protein
MIRGINLYIIKRRLLKKHQRIIKPKSIETCKIDGVYNFYSIKNGKKKQIDEKHNLVMTDVHYRIARAFLGYSLSLYYEIKYCAIGTDNTAVTATDSVLGAEVFRMPYVAIDNALTTTVNASFYITTTDYVGSIEEVGIFGGSTASGTVDTGYLLSHVLWSYTKSGSEELLIEYVITLS